MANTISIIIQAKDNASAVLSSTAASLQTTADRMNSVGQGMMNVGKSASIGLTLPIGLVGGAAIKMAGDFEQSLNILQSVSGATADQMEALRQKARDLGNDITLPGISAGDAANAMTELAKAGLSVNDVLTASKGVLSLAKAGQIDVADAAQVAARALNAFGLSGDQATKIADLLAAGANSSTASVQDMALGLEMAGAQSHQMGVSLQDTVTALALFSNAGINGSDAGTSLKQMFIQLATPTQQARDLMSQLGLKFFDAKGNFIGLANMADLLRDKLSGLTTEQRNSALATIFGSDATRVAAILAESGAQKFDAMSAAVNKQGAAADLAKAQNSGFKGALDNLVSTVETSLTDIGTTLLPALTRNLKSMANEVGRLTNWFDHLSTGQQDMIIKTLTWTAVLGPALLVTGKVVKTIGSLVSVVTTLSKALGFFSTAKVVSEANLAARALGTAGLAGAATEGTAALGGAGLLSALGPVGLVMGAAGIAAGGAYLAFKKFKDSGQEVSTSLKTDLSPATRDYVNLSKEVGVTIQGTSSKVDLLTLAQNDHKNALNLVTAAINNSKTATQSYSDAQAILKQKQDAVSQAQQDVQDKLTQFGANSPQYQSAVSDLSQKQQDYDQQLQNTAWDSLDLQVKLGEQSKAENNLAGSSTNLALTQQSLNSYLEGGVGVIAKFGPTASSQVTAIDTLQGHLSTVISSWNGLVTNFGQQNADLNGGLQGLGSTLSRVQGQSDKLNQTLSASKNSLSVLQNAGASLQGSSVTLQGKHALGTEFAPGGLSLVGEQGPELVQLPTGSKVTSTHQTQQMVNGGSRTVNIANLNVHNNIDANAVIRKIGFKLATA